MIGILDYGIGNVGAFLRIFHSQNISSRPIKTPEDFCGVDKVVLPGVGAFDSAMDKLNKSGLRSELDNFVLNQAKPLLAVCIGMHMLSEGSEEGVTNGLGYLDGQTIHMGKLGRSESKILLPHMGWNEIITRGDSLIWEDINLKQGFYFLHSYCFKAKYSESVIGVSDYHGEVISAVRSENVYGFQFHPEKSLNNGIRLLTNFAMNI